MFKLYVLMIIGRKFSSWTNLCDQNSKLHIKSSKSITALISSVNLNKLII